MAAWNFARELARFGPAADYPTPSPAEAAAYCAGVTKAHYENFTVASWLLPRRLRPHFHAVYAYCRWADDLADETGGGESTLKLLDWWRGELATAYDCSARHPVMVTLADTVAAFRIPREPFLNLLVAFAQDQRVKRYDTFDQLLGYCANSANPVGRIVLHLFGCPGGDHDELSDAICTGLQLANFWQDVARDAAIRRTYLPREDLDRFGVSPADIATGRSTPAFREMLKFQVERTRGFFDRGRPLLDLVPRRLRIDLDLFLRGGEAILNAIETQGHDVLTSRPVVSKAAKLRLLAGAVLSSVGHRPAMPVRSGAFGPADRP